MRVAIGQKSSADMVLAEDLLETANVAVEVHRPREIADEQIGVANAARGEHDRGGFLGLHGHGVTSGVAIGSTALLA